MSNFLTQCSHLTNDEFIARIKIAMYKAAIQIVGEAGTEYTPEGKTKRHNLAMQVLFGQHVTNFATAIVSSNGAINTESTDNDLEFMVVSVFNSMASLTSEDLV